MADENNKQHRPESYPKPTEMDAALKQQDEYTTLKPNEQGTITGVSQLNNTGEMTPKLSLKRKVVMEKYAAAVARIYDMDKTPSKV